jgi:hypothetical protein
LYGTDLSLHAKNYVKHASHALRNVTIHHP